MFSRLNESCSLAYGFQTVVDSSALLTLPFFAFFFFQVFPSSYFCSSDSYSYSIDESAKRPSGLILSFPSSSKVSIGVGAKVKLSKLATTAASKLSGESLIFSLKTCLADLKKISLSKMHLTWEQFFSFSNISKTLPRYLIFTP